MAKYVYSFGGGKADGRGDMKDLLGGKGSGLAEMTNIGLPVPPGFTVTTEACTLFNDNGGQLTPEIEEEIRQALELLESRMNKQLGDSDDPLLVSVRSGAKFSMPGMMDTILNLGLNDLAVEGLAAKTQNPRFAYDAYRRFIMMFANIAKGLSRDPFEHVLEEVKAKLGVKNDHELSAEVLKGQIVPRFKAIYREHSGHDFPQVPLAQLSAARDAVFGSWNNPRAFEYRKQFNIPHNLGTAVNVQAMVFGNKGDTSATGVGFTRDPGTGEKVFYGEFLANAQGEDVVAGIRTPRPIAELESALPDAYRQLREITSRLEKHYRWPQDFEFTIEEGKLYMLQTRNAKSTAIAAFRFACDLVEEGVLAPQDAVMQIDPQAIDQLLHPVFDPKKRRSFAAAAKGLAAGPGAASGHLVFTADDAVAWSKKGKKVVLVRKETSPDDIHGMAAAQGILTATGGMTSHAAVVGRQMGKPCVVGCGVLGIDEDRKVVHAPGGRKLKEGDAISIDGFTGEVILANVPTVDSELLRVVAGKMKPEESPIYQRFAKVMEWADSMRRLKVRANADIPRDAKMAFAFGAEGIGLCRTEHMFFAEERLPIVVNMILSSAAGRDGIVKLTQAAEKVKRSGSNVSQKELKELRQKYGGAVKMYRDSLAKLLPLQRKDFYGLFKEMRGHPVTIRTLDPPLHEFLPRREALLEAIGDARRGKLSKERKAEIAELLKRGEGTSKTKGGIAERLEGILHKVEALHEFNPMLGHRGCRLGITYPEITEMQARAIFEAAALCHRDGAPVKPEVMIPLVGTLAELVAQKEIVVRVAQDVMKEKGVNIDYTVGTMIEVPRAAVTAHEIAREAQFFSFGTNDLTQMTFGYSRDDIGKFLQVYLDARILPRDPFVSIDRNGVGELMRMAVERGRRTRPDIKLGICGEHGGDPSSVEFCHEIGLDYVSASPYRVAIARLAAAQVGFRSQKEAGAKKTEGQPASARPEARA
jgi:pyruvate, orthophosphate dikinase